MEFDLHIHSKYSFDSISKPSKILKIAKKRNLNGIAITDHNTIRGAIEAKHILKNNKENNFFVIIGTEIGTDRGDILGLFIEEEIKSRSTLEVIDEIKHKGGLAILPHPYKRTGHIIEEIITRVDAIEGFNARGEQRSCQSRNKLALNLAKAANKPLTAGSDAHFYFEIGRGRCITDDVSDVEGIRKMILEGKTKVTGFSSSLYVEPLSQVIRMIKLRRYDLFYEISRQVRAITLFQARKFLIERYKNESVEGNNTITEECREYP
jgi:hypothetical protein